MRSRLTPLLCALLSLLAPGLAAAAPEGTLTIAMHFSPVTRWLDPAEGESTITPYLMLAALHDGLLRPTAGQASAPMVLRYQIQASGLIGSPTEPRTRSDDRSNLAGMSSPHFMNVRIAVGAV